MESVLKAQAIRRPLEGALTTRGRATAESIAGWLIGIGPVPVRGEISAMPAGAGE